MLSLTINLQSQTMQSSGQCMVSGLWCSFVPKRVRPGSWMVGRRGEGDRVTSVIFRMGPSYSCLFRMTVDS